MTEFNVNDYVYIQLLPLGRRRLMKNNYDVASIKEDEDGWSKWQMWKLMQVLGPCVLGFESPFKPQIRFEEK